MHRLVRCITCAPEWVHLIAHKLYLEKANFYKQYLSHIALQDLSETERFLKGPVYVGLWSTQDHRKSLGGFSLSETERHLGVVEESASLSMSWFPENIVLTQARYPQSKKSLGGSEQQKKICCLGLKLGNPHQPLHSTMSLLVL